MADKLTPQQAMAVHNRGGKLLVSAAAGSGKTKVLVDRLLEYLMDSNDPANLDEFLIITYTKAAASELRGKIAEKLSERIAQNPHNTHLHKQMQRLFFTKISTVHGFCSDLLREYAYKLDIPADFRVADENECREIREKVLQDLLDEAYRTAQDNPDFCAFADTQGLGRDDKMIPELIQKVYDSSMCHLNPDGWLENCLNWVDTSNVLDVMQTPWGKYLSDNLFDYVDKQLFVLEQCVKKASDSASMEKPVANLKATVEQLRKLKSCTSWDDIVANKEIDYGRLTFPRKNNDPELSERIKAVRNACKKGLDRKLHSFSDPSEQILRDMDSLYASTRGLVELVRKFAENYRKAKRSRHVLDFGDLEQKTLDLLLGKSRGSISATAKEIGKRFREIMVDEYQDSNGVQDAIFRALTAERQNCFLVGDVKQSIYQFRLADPGIFLEKYEEYVHAEDAQPGQGRKVLLSNNFRSGPEVIEAVNDVFRNTMSPAVGGMYYTEAEELREGIPHEPLKDSGVELYAIDVREDTYREEAAFVADKISRMLSEGTLIRKKDSFVPVRPDDIVILLRSPGSVGSAYIKALEARGIRCNSGGGMDLLQTDEIIAFRSLLQTVTNPRQDIPLVSILASPVFGFGADDLAALRENRKCCVYESLQNSSIPKAKHFLEILELLRKEASMKPLSYLLDKCLSLTRLDSIYAAMPGGDAKLANIHSFYKLAVDYENSNTRDLIQFLDYLDIMDNKGLPAPVGNNAGSVTIMSIHKSKGLEFPVVFLCGLSREFNRESLRAQILCDQELGLGLSVADSKNRIRYPSVAKRAISVKMAAESVSEEMRVLYVAMTRARDRLIMTYASKRLEAELNDIALRMNDDGGTLLCMDASCPGDWVMLTAMGRVEAGELFQFGSRPETVRIPSITWKISVSQAPELLPGVSGVKAELPDLPVGAKERIREALSYSYPYSAATAIPSKQTATGLKGRFKDEEAAEDTQKISSRKQWRKPSFRGGDAVGKAYGNAIHIAMQHIRYECCGSIAEIEAEIQRMVDQNILDSEQGSYIDAHKLANFFSSNIGMQLQNGCRCIREFKFSILDDASKYAPGVEGEYVLLQGVVDCALLHDDGITVIDFKTDRVTNESIEQTTEHYRPQVKAYSDALSRIFELPVKASYLYYFRLNQFVKI